MTLSRFVSLPSFALACLCFGGCSQLIQDKVDEESNRHLMHGRECAKTQDFEGARECFEKALDDNRHSATAHFELGLICYQNLTNYAEAIYHFEKFLQFRPADPKAATVNQFILDAKQ